jgi:hypothetical protein
MIFAASQFVLVMMVFVTPPTGGKNRLWALQSTQTIEFDDQPACADAISNVILPAVKSTDTMALTAWCLPKTHQTEARAGFLIQRKQGQLTATQEFSKAAAQVGTCYDYVPPPVNANIAPGQRNVKSGLIGECHHDQ